MMFRSIRWTLLFWYAVILVGSLTALGWTLLREMERTLYRDADAQLSAWLAAVSNAQVRTSPTELRAELSSTLPPRAVAAVWNPEGRQIIAVGNVPSAGPPWDQETETVGHVRVRRRLLESGVGILVGKHVENAHHRVRDFLIVLLVASVGIVVLALGGGFLLVRRALAPLRGIAATARRISGENLGERIETHRIQNELGDLALTLNECFGRLEEAVARQVRFTADASHELRTPLAIALSHLELARTRDRSAPELRERLEIVEDAARRMKGIVAGLLTLARADAGELELERVPVNLSPLLEDVKKALAPLAAARGITIHHELAPVTVRGDPDRLAEVATNLYTNAVRYGRDGGPVRVTLAEDGACAILRVTDSGEGIPVELHEKVFERFFRGDAARNRAVGGSGLGLAIVRNLVALHGGDVTVASQPGAGATFTVRLPLAP